MPTLMLVRSRWCDANLTSLSRLFGVHLETFPP